MTLPGSPWCNVKTTRKKLFVIAVMSFALAACGGTPKSGVVRDRHYEGAWDELQMHCISYDTKTGACTNQMPQWVHHEEECSFYLVHKDATGRESKGWRVVPCAAYATYSVGDHYPKVG